MFGLRCLICLLALESFWSRHLVFFSACFHTSIGILDPDCLLLLIFKLLMAFWFLIWLVLVLFVLEYFDLFPFGLCLLTLLPKHISLDIFFFCSFPCLLQCCWLYFRNFGSVWSQGHQRGTDSLQPDSVDVSEGTLHSEQTPHRETRQWCPIPGSEGTSWIIRKAYLRVPSPSVEHRFISVTMQGIPRQLETHFFLRI